MMGRSRGCGGGGRADGSLRFGARDEPPPPRRSSGWGVAPPSRHLWVGSLAPGVTASDLSELFIRCGEVEGIDCDPGRSFAFVSLVREEDAVTAIRELQGARLHRAPIRIEFSKGVSVEHRPASLTDKSSGTSIDDRYTQYADERHFIERGKIQQPSPEKSIDKFKRNKSTEPSEVLWIGFPAGLKVNEATLWEPFSPFGEIAKITTFPGRTYAFVKYTTATAACRAKEALQGRLFNNPRVSICFSRNEGVAAEVGKGSSSAQYLPHSNPSAQHIFKDQDFEVFPRPRDFDSPPRDLRISLLNFVPERLPRDTDDVGFSRDSYSRHGPEVEPGPVSSFELFRTQRLGPERTMSEDLYEQRRSSSTVRSDAPWHNIPFERPRRPLQLEVAWDTEDNSYPFPKKLRIGEVHDAELPEYPFSEFDQGHAGSGYQRTPFHDLPEDDAHPTTYQLAPVDGRNYRDPLRNPTPLVVRHEPWRSRNNFGWGLGKVDGSSPEHDEPLPKEEWKWNGTIAKGGTPICRARSFPVGKVLNFMLPEFVNCTARTNLEMLAKHYYEAASSWVLFFVPENDVDMAAYNDFMNYLGDKQRAAVCKLGKRSTLFLVPPSDFSENVLRVPGKVSISGVILKFQQSNPDLTSTNRQPEALEQLHPSFASHLNSGVSSHADLDALRRPKLPDIRTHHQGPDYLRSSAGTYTPASTDFTGTYTPASTDFTPYKFENVPSYLGSQLAKQVQATNSCREMAHDQYQRSPNAWPSHWSNNNDPSPGYNSSATSTISHAFNDRTSEPYSFVTQGVPKGTTSGYSPGEASNMSLPSMEPTLQQVVRSQQPPSLPGLLPPEQLAQLAILLAQQNQRGKEADLPIDVSNKQSGSIQNSNPHKHGSMMSDRPGFIPVHNSQLPVPPSAPSQLQVHVPPIQAHPSIPLGSFVPPLPEGPPPSQLTWGSASAQPMLPSGQQIGQQLSAQEDLDGDPQKRLQATLQLAATLLQQIQNQSKPGGQK